jgi:hypothetical protein
MTQTSAEWDHKIQESNDLFEKRRSEIEERHSRERQEFTAQWSNPDFLLSFCKASPQLLQLRQVQRNHALSKDFDGAIATKSIADRRQAIEEADSLTRAKAAMRTQYQQMAARQSRELEAVNTHKAQQTGNLQELKEHEITQLRQAIRRLEVRRAGPLPKIPAPPEAAPNESGTSPSTRMSLISYRTSRGRAKLNVPGISLEQCLQPSKAHTQQPWRPRTIKRYRQCF